MLEEEQKYYEKAKEKLLNDNKECTKSAITSNVINEKTEKSETNKESLEKLDVIKKLKKKKIIFRNITLGLLISDFFIFYCISTLYFSYKSFYTNYNIIVFVLELAFSALIIAALLYSIIKSKRKPLLICLITYTTLGFVYALITLLSEIKFLDPAAMREIKYKTEFYSMKIYLIVFILNIFCWTFRVSACVVGSFYYYFNDKFEKEFQVTNSNDHFIYGRRISQFPKEKGGRSLIDNEEDNTFRDIEERNDISIAREFPSGLNSYQERDYPFTSIPPNDLLNEEEEKNTNIVYKESVAEKIKI
jgi:hypothetical protein